MKREEDQTAAAANIERALPFAGPLLALGAMLVVALTTGAVVMMMAG